MNDLGQFIFWSTWLIFVDLFVLIIHTIRCGRLRKSIPRASLATSPKWRDRHFPLTGWFAYGSICNFILLPMYFYMSQESFDQTCSEKYLPTECDGATKSWTKFCIWLILPGVLAIVVSTLWVIRVRRQVAACAQNNNTPSSKLLYHPGPLLFANGFLVLASTLCRLTGGPAILYKDMNFKTWFRVTEALSVAAIAAFIIGSVLTIYGLARFLMEWSTYRGIVRPRAEPVRRRSRRSRREWIELE